VFVVFIVMFGIVFGGVVISSLRVDALRRGSEARILAARAARLMRGGGIVMGVWGFWVVGGRDVVVVIAVVAVVVVAVKS